MKIKNCTFRSLVVIVVVLITSKQLSSQPSGGPYGPVAQMYDLPVTDGKIFYVAPDGKATSDGSVLKNPTTIEKAISMVKTRDVIIMRGGIYRTGNLIFNQGITIQPYRDEKPVLKGTLVASEWKKEGALWSISWDYLFPAGPASWWNRETEEKYTPMHRFNNDAVFIDGKFLQSAGSKEEVNENTFFVNYKLKKIYIGVNPINRLVEITAFKMAILRTTRIIHDKKSDGRGPVIKGITIMQYPETMVQIEGYYPNGIVSEKQIGKDVIGTRFENCTFSDCFRIGVLAIGDGLVMKNCEVRNTNTEGVYIVASSDIVLEKNIFANNNIERWTGYYPASVKIFNQTRRVICRDNKIIDQPFSNGVWYDVGNIDGIFVNNWVENVGNLEEPFRKKSVWPSYNGFLFEISKGALCAGNVFVNSDHGILILNSSNVAVYNNTFINSMACFNRTERGDSADHFGWHPSTGPGVEERDGHSFVNNLCYVKGNYSKPLLFVVQPAKLCQRLGKPQLSLLNSNIYVKQAPDKSTPIILWSPYKNENCQLSVYDPVELNRLYGDFSSKSRYHRNYEGNLFKDEKNKDFRLSDEFKSKQNASSIPDNIKKNMSLKEEQDFFIGAYH